MNTYDRLQEAYVRGLSDGYAWGVDGDNCTPPDSWAEYSAGWPASATDYARLYGPREEPPGSYDQVARAAWGPFPLVHPSWGNTDVRVRYVSVFNHSQEEREEIGRVRAERRWSYTRLHPSDPRMARGEAVMLTLPMARDCAIIYLHDGNSERPIAFNRHMLTDGAAFRSALALWWDRFREEVLQPPVSLDGAVGIDDLERAFRWVSVHSTDPDMQGMLVPVPLSGSGETYYWSPDPAVNQALWRAWCYPLRELPAAQEVPADGLP